MEDKLEEWAQLQTISKINVIKEDMYKEEDIKYVGGLDISFDKNDTEKACAYLTVMDINTFTVVYEHYLMCKMHIPYISGFLGFREVNPYQLLLDRIRDKPFFPQVVLVDGFGILHQREYGSASQLGVMCDIPTIGVAKTLLSHDGLNEHQVRKDFVDNCKVKGDTINLIGTSGTLWGKSIKVK